MDTSKEVAKQTTRHDAQEEPSRFDLGLIGQRLGGKYLIEDTLGSGGMSVVYKGKQESTERTVAIKTLKMDFCSDPVMLQRFEREVKGLSRLNHPNIVTVFDCIITPQGQPYVVMDYIDGESLEQLLRREKVVDSGRTIKILLQICLALEHAHRNGLVHRDIKPGNIMLARCAGNSDTVKVVDFGLAKFMENQQRLTLEGQLWGSAPYMSPEQCMADENVLVDHRSDVYAVGAVAYEMLTGKDPFWSTDLATLISSHINVLPPKFKDANADVEVLPVLEAIVFKALAKSPEHRFQSMLEFKEALSFAGAPMLKAEEAKQVRELQAKLEAQNKRAQQENKVKQNTLRKAQQKEKFKILPAVVISSLLTFGITICSALYLSQARRANQPQQQVVQPLEVPSRNRSSLTETSAVDRNLEQTKKKLPSNPGVVTRPHVSNSIAKIRTVGLNEGKTLRHLPKHVANPVPKQNLAATNSPPKDVWSKLERMHSN